MRVAGRVPATRAASGCSLSLPQLEQLTDSELAQSGGGAA